MQLEIFKGSLLLFGEFPLVAFGGAEHEFTVPRLQTTAAER
jgi:hypothetical protein